MCNVVNINISPSEPSNRSQPLKFSVANTGSCPIVDTSTFRHGPTSSLVNLDCKVTHAGSIVWASRIGFSFSDVHLLQHVAHSGKLFNSRHHRKSRAVNGPICPSDSGKAVNSRHPIRPRVDSFDNCPTESGNLVSLTQSSSRKVVSVVTCPSDSGRFEIPQCFLVSTRTPLLIVFHISVLQYQASQSRACWQCVL